MSDERPHNPKTPQRLRPVLETVTPSDEAPASPQDAAPPPDAEAPPARAARAPVFGGWGRLAFWAIGALASAGVALSAHDLVVDLMSRHTWLGWAALGLVGAAAVGLLGLAIGELAGLARLKRLEGLRAQAEGARAAQDADRARAYARGLQALYAGRGDLGVDWGRLADLAHDAADAGARLDLYERKALGPLDAAARAEVRGHAGRVAAATALMPSALLDGLAALYLNLRMIRRIARIYGGRGGALGSWRLARKVVEHAMAAGLIALGDDLLEPLLGGGIASKLSRRAGEGVVNGALTARIGAAAMEVCRPAPFVATPRPRLRELAWDALRRAER